MHHTKNSHLARSLTFSYCLARNVCPSSFHSQSFSLTYVFEKHQILIWKSTKTLITDLKVCTDHAQKSSTQGRSKSYPRLMNLVFNLPRCWCQYKSNLLMSSQIKKVLCLSPIRKENRKKKNLHQRKVIRFIFSWKTSHKHCSESSKTKHIEKKHSFLAEHSGWDFQNISTPAWLSSLSAGNNTPKLQLQQ